MKGKRTMDKIRLNSSCLICMAEKQLMNYGKDASEEERLLYMQKVMKIFAEAKAEESSPVVTGRIFDLQKEMFGEAEDYAKIKHTYNQMMLELESEIENKIQESKDPLKRAIQYAMIGNYIDFGALSSVDNAKLMELLGQADKHEVNEEEYKALKKDLEHGTRLVYLTDNCGEVVLDKILVKLLKKMYPNLDITVIVRGEQILNDATMEDAVQIGMTDITKVIRNGNNIAGTWLDAVSDEALELIDQADLLIAKGQGNFETLYGCGKNIYYMFLCKCQLFTERFGVKQFEGILINDKKCRG